MHALLVDVTSVTVCVFLYHASISITVHIFSMLIKAGFNVGIDNCFELVLFSLEVGLHVHVFV